MEGLTVGTKDLGRGSEIDALFFLSLLVGRRFLVEIVAVYIILNGVLRKK